MSVKSPLVTNALVALEAVLEKNEGATLSEAPKEPRPGAGRQLEPELAVRPLLLRQFVGSDREAFRRVWSIAMTGEGRRGRWRSSRSWLR